MASTYDITMKQYNGTDYDTLYPTADLANNVSGVLPLANGGTGVTSLMSLAQTLITSMGMTTHYSGSYIGTGTSGSANPTTITAPWTSEVSGAPRALIVAGSSGLMVWLLSSNTAPVIICVTGGSPGTVNTVSYNTANKTVSWYGTNTQYQLNMSGVTYFWFALR